MALVDDGAGKGFSAQVDEKLRLQVSGQADTEFVVKSIEGLGFFIHSGVINLTSDSKSAVLYVKNTSNKDLVINKAVVNLGNSDGTGDTLYQLTSLPTAGTIVTGTEGVDYNTVVPLNNNLSKLLSDPFEGVARAGVQGTTATGSFNGAVSLVQAPTYLTIPATLTVPKGSGLVVFITPPAGNTDLNIVIDISAYYS